jgi:hypothetical protein
MGPSTVGRGSGFSTNGVQGDCVDPIGGGPNRETAEAFPTLEVWLNAGPQRFALSFHQLKLFIALCFGIALGTARRGHRLSPQSLQDTALVLGKRPR